MRARRAAGPSRSVYTKTNTADNDLHSVYAMFYCVMCLIRVRGFTLVDLRGRRDRPTTSSTRTEKSFLSYRLKYLFGVARGGF